MNRRFFLDIDWGLIVPILVLATLSLTTLFSIDFSLFKNQFIYFIIGIFAFLFFSRTNYRTVDLYAIPIYIASIVLLGIILLIGIETRGSVRWLEFLGFRIQFSEIFKPFLAISLSYFLAKEENYSLKRLFFVLCFMSPIVFLIFLQPDLGNALIYFMTVVFTLIVFGFPLRFFFAGILLIAAIFPVFWNFLHDYQRNRLLTFFNPTDPLGLSYNAIQSSIAVGSGMMSGRGLGAGTQAGLKFLPELHTDFIFATISEELGFIGAAIMILAFSFLLYKIYQVFSKQEETFCKVFSITAFFLIFLQFFINIGMNIGIVPIVGITLPFVSYGGSSLLSNFILLGILSSLNRRQSSKHVLEIG